MSTTKQNITLEQRANDEANQLKAQWGHGAYNFLLQRTLNFYSRSKTENRRLKIQETAGAYLYPILDEVLMSLYQHSCNKFQKSCKIRYGNDFGFHRTPSERKFIETLESILREHPEFKRVEIYPSLNYSLDLPKNFKMVLGNHVPDFILFGIKNDKASAVVIEIDGDTHISKYRKDFLKYEHFKELKIFTFSIQNEQVQDRKHILQCLTEMYRQPSGALQNQIQYAKRMIWTKTIACNMTLSEIDAFIYEKYKFNPNLELESSIMIKMKDCPRKIRAELLNTYNK